MATPTIGSDGVGAANPPPALPVAPPPRAVSQPVPSPGPGILTMSTTSAIPIPRVLTIPDMTLQFGRLNSTRRRVTVTVDPGKLSRVINSTYDAMEVTIAGLGVPTITKEAFLRITRTLLVKRLQDILEFQNGVRPTGALQLARVIDLPQPIAELLYNLGPYYCQLNGKQYYYDLVPKPNTDVPDWWTVDTSLLGKYRLFIDQCRDRYMILSFPRMSDMTGSPLMLTAREEATDMTTVRAYLNCAQPSDGFLRFVHEEFFVDLPFTYNDCDLIMTPTLYTYDVISAYVRSYIIKVQ